MDIGLVLSRQRQEKGISQKQLAELIGVSTGTVAEWESGESFPSLEQLQYICTILEIDINQVSRQYDNLEQIVVDEQHTRKNTSHKRIIAFIICAFFFVSIVTGVVWYISHSRKPNEKMIIPFSDDPEAIEIAEKSVVKLNCYNTKDVLISSGSGVCLFDQRIIVTNYHVVEKVSKVEIVMYNDEHFITNQVVAYDKDRDIVFLKTPDNLVLTSLQTGDDTIIKKGEKVVTISSPIGITNSVSTGVFSGTIIDDHMKILQFTAPISHGSSGGALFNDKGEVIGITFGAFESGQNINLAVPISEIEHIYKERGTVVLNISDIYDLSPIEELMDLLSDKEKIDMGYYDFRDVFTTLNPNTVYFVSAFYSSCFIDTNNNRCVLTFSEYERIGKERDISRDEPKGFAHKTQIYEDGFFECSVGLDYSDAFKRYDQCIIICSPSYNHDHIVVYGIMNLETDELINILGTW